MDSMSVRSFVFFLVASVALGLVVVGTAGSGIAHAASSGDETPESYLQERFGFSLEEALEWVELSGDAPGIAAIARQMSPEAFSGVAIDFGTRTITVYVTQGAESVRKQATDRYPAVAPYFKMVTVDRSFDDLERIFTAIVETRDAAGAENYWPEVNIERNAVVIYSEDLTMEVQQELQAAYGTGVVFSDGAHRAQGTATCDDPSTCNPPARGSIRYGNTTTTTEYDCTSGFVSRNTAGSWYIMTAGHCVDGGYEAYQNTDNYGRRLLFGVPGGGDVTSGRVDGARGYMGSAEVSFWNPSRWVWHKASEPNFQIHNKIGSSGSIPSGALICRGGGKSWSDCGSVRSPLTSVTVNYGGDEGTQNMVLMSTRDMCSRLGDSGGPIYSRQSSNGISSSTAYAIQSASSDGTSTCTSSEILYASIIPEIENAIGIQVWCGGSAGGNPNGPQGCLVY